MWMTNLPTPFKSMPINQLCLPGTHNSGAYNLDLAHPIVNSTSSFSKTLKLVKKLRYLPFLKYKIASFTLCQDYTIYQQLKMGVRFLDLRLSYRDNGDISTLPLMPEVDEHVSNFYITHTFTCIPLHDALSDIVKFVTEYPTEIIILSIKPDWEHRSVMISAYPVIKNYLVNYLAPSQITFPSISRMNLNGHSIIMFYDTLNNEYSWNINLLNNPWFNTNNTDELYMKVMNRKSVV